MSGMRQIAAAITLAGLAALAAGCDEPSPAPDRPTWFADVQPILRANCFHCHGSLADFARLGTKRWDFLYDPMDPQLRAIGDFSSVFEGQGGASPTDALQKFQIGAFIAANDLTRMPPPPATPLSARDIKVVQTWLMQPNPEKGTRSPNAKPTADWLNVGKTFVVKDADRDQVLGKVRCGAMEALLIRSGTHVVPEGTGPPCTVTLYDGLETNVVTLN